MPIKYSIEKAVLNDVDAIKACARSAYEKYVERIGREPAPMIADFEHAIKTQHVYVARSQNYPMVIIGYVVFYKHLDHLQLENVAVHPNAQNMGVGGKLIAFVENYCHTASLNAIELYTNEKMTENISLYPKLGYQETDRRQEDGFNRVYFRKEIG